MTPLILLYITMALASLEVYSKKMKSVRHGKVVGIVRMDLTAPPQEDELIRIKRRIDDMPLDKEYQRRTAPTATPDTAQCSVEVRVVRRIYGYCQPLGMGAYSTNACVAGNYLNLDADNGCNPPVQSDETASSTSTTTND